MTVVMGGGRLLIPGQDSGQLLAPPRPAAWSPLSLPNLAAWYDASDAGSITESSGAVSQWDDLSGNANHLVQATGTNQPTTGTRTINSLNVIDFIDNDWLSPASNFMSGASAATLLYVAILDSQASQYGGGPVGSGWGSSGANNHYTFEDGNVYCDWGSTTRPSFGNPTLTAAHVGSLVTASADRRWYVNGSLTYTSGTNTVGWGGGTPSFGMNSGSFNWNGAMAGIIMCSSALSDADRQAAEDYYSTKWATP